MRTLYAKRRQALIRALKLQFEDRVAVLGENAGMHLMVRLQTNFSDEEVIRRATEAGVGLLSAKIYYLNDSRSGEFVFGYGGLSERRISDGIKRLAKALR